MRFPRHMLVPCKGVTLSIGALLGNLEGVCLLEFLTEKKKLSGFLFGPIAH